MDARRRDGDQHVAGRDIGTGQQRAALGGADGEAREVIVLAVIHARHLGGFAADEGAAGDAAALGDTLDNGRAGLDVEPAGGEIVEEEQGLGALHDDVVDAHRNQVLPDGAVVAGVDGDLELGADAIVGRNEDRIDETGRLEVEQATETTDLGVGSGASRGTNRRLDRFHKGIAGIDVDARLLV